jgi:hypothetical protein
MHSKYSSLKLFCSHTTNQKLLTPKIDLDMLNIDSSQFNITVQGLQSLQLLIKVILNCLTIFLRKNMSYLQVNLTLHL